MLAALLGLLGTFVVGAAAVSRQGDKESDSEHTTLKSSPELTTVPELVPEPEPELQQPAPDPEPQQPAPEPQPQPEPAPQQPAPEPVTPPSSVPVSGTESSSDGLDRGALDVISHDSVLDVDGGRVTTLEFDAEKSISSVEIISGPAYGNATVNPDQSIALVLSGSDYSGPLSISYRVNYDDGDVEDLTLDMNVTPVQQAAGWGMGQHYMLEEDDNGDIIVETGENHRKVYVSESEDALSRADIAALEGLSEKDITDRWLLDNPEYGGSDGMALSTDVGLAVWQELIGPEKEPGSHWLLFESGYEYGDLGRFMDSAASGESALHPLHITSWGEGPAPVLSYPILLTQDGYENVVISDLRMNGGINSYESKNILVSDTEVEGNGINIRFNENFTLHDSSVSYNVSYENDGEIWTAWEQGLVVKETDGVLVEGSIFHHNGWEDGYRADSSIEGPVSPNGFSHNVYFQWDTLDVTFRDNISSQASSYGAKLRAGGFAEENVFLDNNVAVDMLGGNYKDFGHVGNFTFFADNVITSAGYKDGKSMGSKAWGMQNKGLETTWLDNIVAHLADPDDPADLASKPNTDFDIDSTDGTLAFDNTKSLNWIGANPDWWKGNETGLNLEGVDIDTAMQTTIQRYAAQLTDGKVTTIDGLADYLLSLADTEFDDTITARDIVAYFQDGFGMTLDGPDVDAHRFIPNNIADGVRWDNRVNWDSGQLPGAGDSVDLGGNWVQYSGTTSLSSLDMGSGGRIAVNSGKLTVNDKFEAGADGGRLTIDEAGQFWTAGYSGAGRLEIAAMGGRFANMGDFDGLTSIHASEDAQVILATDGGRMVLGEQDELRLEGSEVRVGFDGDQTGPAVLQMADDATLSFVADEKGFSTLSEFRSGRWDQEDSPVQSGVSLNGTLQIDLSDYAGGAGAYQLIKVDALGGSLDDIRVYGLKPSLDARVVTDYEADILQLEINEGAGRLTTATVGAVDDAQDEAAALWEALTAGQGIYDDTSEMDLAEAHEEMEEQGRIPELLL